MLACCPLYLQFQTLHQHDAAFVIANVRSNSAPRPALRQSGNRQRKRHVRFGSKADICSAQAHVRFTPNSDRKSGFPANGHVRFTQTWVWLLAVTEITGKKVAHFTTLKQELRLL
jgi:hypothetical protein